ncbi:MAG: aldehyde ferredoxin oxidoreductase family protein [Thermodesulfobacteriota bacterium]
MNGFNGKIARIDLSSRNITIETPAETFYRSYLGGRGIIVHTLLKEVPRNTDPFAPANKLVFALGPISGHPFVGSGRHSVGCRSPLSGGYGESEAGGYWGAELKKAGFDALIIEGAAASPVYLWIQNGSIEIRDAGHLWGLDTAAAHSALGSELGDDRIRTAVIGPAGEKRVRFSCILHDITHVAGRTGTGAVMGAKNLKAVAVKGARAPRTAAPQKLKAINHAMLTNFKERSKHWMLGTGRGIVNHEKTGNIPIRNFTGGKFPGIEKITPQILCEHYLVKMAGCYGCPIRCKRVVRLEQPYAVDPVYGGPEYETLAALGSNCGIDDLAAITKANELCNRYGIDTISTGVVISFAMDCYEHNILTAEDTEGLELTFGNAPAMLEMVERIARRKGLGDLLAEGSRRAAEKIGRGAIDFAMQVKGAEIPMHEPRLKQAMGVHYSTHATGADHATGISEISPLDDNSAQKLHDKGFTAQLVNYLGLCKFVPWSHEEVKAALASITGWEMDSVELMRVVERGVTLARIFNIREGFSAKDDSLPKRFAATPPDSPLKGIDPQKLRQAQQTYYRIMGWDERGVPTLEKLNALEINWAAEYLTL